MAIAISGIISVTVIIVALVMSAAAIISKTNKEQTNSNVMYLCDKSKWCGADQCVECEHTTHIEHAVNFKREKAGSRLFYFEEPTDGKRIAH